MEGPVAETGLRIKVVPWQDFRQDFLSIELGPWKAKSENGPCLPAMEVAPSRIIYVCAKGETGGMYQTHHSTAPRWRRVQMGRCRQEIQLWKKIFPHDINESIPFGALKVGYQVSKLSRLSSTFLSLIRLTILSSPSPINLTGAELEPLLTVFPLRWNIGGHKAPC